MLCSSPVIVRVLAIVILARATFSFSRFDQVHGLFSLLFLYRYPNMDKTLRTQGLPRAPRSSPLSLLFLSFLLWPLALVHAGAPPAGCPTDISAVIQDLNSTSISKRMNWPDSKNYAASLETYFSVQENLLQPAVIIQPKTADEVSEILQILLKNQKAGKGACFAVRGGGKGPWEGAANIEGGVTIDLKAFNLTKISEKREGIRVGAGLRWADVYKVTDEANLSIVGGRDGTVGVAGLTLGGGMSFFGPQAGFVCDNVIAYEIVMADGQHLIVSEDDHEDLFRALKGGSNNFGIVLSFVFKLSPFGKLAQLSRAMAGISANPPCSTSRWPLGRSKNLHR